MKKKLSLVVPVFNEAEAIYAFCDKAIIELEHIDIAWEILFVDDGSTDDSIARILDKRRSHPNVKLVALSRNFGKEAALTAGLSYAGGDAVVLIDVDLQDPPELISEMVGLWRQGYKVVLGKRTRRQFDSMAKRTSAKLFHKLMRNLSEVEIPSDVGDFRLMDRSVVDAVLRYPERTRFMKGLMASAGFKTISIPYSRPERRSGVTKWNFLKLWNLALDGITSFSTIPLRIWTYIGTVIAFLSFLMALYVVARAVLFGDTVPGIPSVLTAVLFIGGIQLIGIGVIGEYLGRTLMEVKQRPLFIVESTSGIDHAEIDAARPATTVSG